LSVGDVQLTDDEKSYFSKFESVFNSPEWAAVTDEWRKDLAELPVRAFYEARSWDEILAARAVVAKLQEYLTYPRQIELREQAILFERSRYASDKRDMERPDV
jgi:hypothetical protein